VFQDERITLITAGSREQAFHITQTQTLAHSLNGENFQSCF